MTRLVTTLRRVPKLKVPRTHGGTSRPGWGGLDGALVAGRASDGFTRPWVWPFVGTLPRNEKRRGMAETNPPPTNSE